MKIHFSDDSHVSFRISANEVTMSFYDGKNKLLYSSNFTVKTMRVIRDEITKAIVMAEVAAMSDEELDKAVLDRKKKRFNVVMPFPSVENKDK